MDERKPRGWIAWVMGLMLSLLGLYVLAPGPLLLLLRWGYLPRSVGRWLDETIYAPVSWLHRSSDVGRWVLDIYRGLWVP